MNVEVNEPMAANCIGKLPVAAFTAIRMNVKETFSRDMADVLIRDVNQALEKLEATHTQPHHEVRDRGHHH